MMKMLKECWCVLNSHFNYILNQFKFYCDLGKLILSKFLTLFIPSKDKLIIEVVLA